MLNNYFITALRNLARQKSTTFINISGLSLGITCSLVLFLLVRHMSSFDTYHSKAHRIYRIVGDSDGNNSRTYTPGVPVPLPDAFRMDFPEAEEVTFLSYRRNALITIEKSSGTPEKYIEKSGVAFAEPNFFKIFDRPVLTGDVAGGLDEPNEAVVSLRLAEKYFGTTDAIGKVFSHQGIEFRISAIIGDAPSNTDIPVDLLMSFATIKKNAEESGWGSVWSDEQCYVLLPETTSAETIEARLPAFADKHIGSDNYNHMSFHLQPLLQMHFDKRYSNLSDRSSPKEALIALGIVGLFLILTACINFINLSTAEAIKRSREVGIRKTLGSSRVQLILQFMGETTLITVAAVIVSAGFTQLLLNFMGAFLNTEIPMRVTDPLLWLYFGCVTAGVSILAGLYPSFVMSGYRPAAALRNLAANHGGMNVRRSLVVTQFVISQFFIIGTIVLVQQMDYFQKKDLGFRKDAILILPIPEREEAGSASSKMRTLRDDVARMAGVGGASLANSAPSSSGVNGTVCRLEGTSDEEAIKTQIKTIDGNYLELFDLPLVAGRAVADGDTATGFLVNEEFVKEAGFSSAEDILGRKLIMWDQTLPIVGVVRNFHTVSLRQPIEPTVLMNRIRNYGTLSVQINSANLQEVVATIKTRWEQAYPEHLFDYQFVDEHIRSFYDGEKRMSVLLSVFTGIAIFIGCLGLLGLATFMANQKTREIGVRKVLGASVASIIILFTKEYIRLLVIGFCIAAPCAWFVMDKWLEHFAYKITPGPLVFLSGFVVTVLVALGTVGYRSVHAATVNPVSSLRAD